MASSVTVKVEGLRELGEAMAELPKATQTNVMRRVLMKRGQIIADKAQSLAPVREGVLRRSIVVSTRAAGGTAGKAAFAKAMRSGASRKQAQQALREANKNDPEAGDAVVFIGPTGVARFYAHLVEFGSSKNTARGFMRGAFDSTQDVVLNGIKEDLRAEIDKAVQRMRRKAAKKAG